MRERQYSEALSNLAGDKCVGDEITALVHRYEATLYQFLMPLLGSRDEALDVLQDTFIRCYEQLAAGKEIQGSWLFKVARNRAIDLQREKGRGRSLAIRLHTNTSSATTDDHARVTRALGRLSGNDQELLLLCEVDGLCARDIGAILDIRPGAVYTRLFRARERLRRALTLQMENNHHDT